jgi:cystathionine gamma-synthase
MYWALRGWLLDHATRWGLEVTLVDTTDLAALEQAVRPGRTRLVWVETPANPTWDVTDIAATAGIARAAGARLAVDSTAATPVLTRPLGLGADLVMHSATKYLNGHSDLLAGVLVAKEPGERWAAIKADRHDAGALLGPFEAWLLLRGLRTLALRVRQASKNALAIARFLEGHSQVERVLYPGLPNHPEHALAQRQMDGGFGGLLSFLVKGDAAAALAVAGRLRLVARATSLGGTESLIEHRFTIEGAATGVPPNLLRLSVGIEDAEDLIADLAQALA